VLDFLRQDHMVTTALPETLARMGNLASRLETGMEVAAAAPVAQR